MSTGKTIRLKDYQPTPYSIDSVDLLFVLNPKETTVTSKVVFRRNDDTPVGTPLVLDGDEITFVSARIDGDKPGDNSFKAREDGFELLAPPEAATFELEIITTCSPVTNTRLMGLFQSNGVYCTQCEADGFRRITYFYDRPDVLTTYRTRIEASKTEAPVLLGNGDLVEQGDLPDGRHFAVWHDPHPKPSYLFALVGGDLGSIHDTFTTASGRRVELGIYVEKGKENRAHYAMDALKRSMKWDEEQFGREYDLGIFNVVAVSDFNMGAMENKGLNVFNDKYVLADPETATDADYANIEAIIAHEYFHNWTGNRITCRDWFQLCLKEGLTVYRDQEFSADMRSRSVVRIAEVRKLQALQFPEDGGPLAHPVRPEKYREINNLYTTTVYEKGAELVRMIATIVGKKGFRKGMDLYFERHDGEAARVEDFLSAFEDANDISLEQFALWYAQAGTPQLTVSAHYDKANKICNLEIEQSLAATPGQSRKKLMHIPLRFGLIGQDGRDIKTAGIDGGHVEGDIIHLTRRNTRLSFHAIDERPVISLLRGFSAPVTMEFNQKKQDQLFQARHDSDLFNRWQTLQNLAMQNLIAATGAVRKDKPVQLDNQVLDILCDTACDDALEPTFRALALALPGGMEVSRMIGRDIDPDAIHSARMKFIVALAAMLDAELLPLMQKLETPGPFSPKAGPAGKRALRNQVLGYAVHAGSREALALARKQLENASNMTDRASALVMLSQYEGDSTTADDALDTFYDMYKDDPLVIDKWLMIQATIPGAKTLERVRKLAGHSSFSLSNPNRTRSLIGGFASNQTAFNRADGASYDFFAETVLEVDKINPQVAARLLTALRSWRVLEKIRQQKAKAALEKIAAAQLSNDTRDIVERTLAS